MIVQPDIQDLLQLTTPYEARLDFEALLADLSASLTNLPTSRVDGEIERGLKMIVEFLNVDRSSIIEFGNGNEQLRVTHSYAVPGLENARGMAIGARFPWYAARVLSGEMLVLRRVPDDLPADALPERAYSAQHGLKSNVTIPLFANREMLGVVAFASFRSYMDWPDRLLQRLRLVGQIFASALARKRAESELQRLSGRLISAQEEERSRIARELHDDLNQGLALLAVELEQLEQRLPESEGDVAQRLRELQSRTLELSSDVHRLSHQLHPSKLDHLGLVAAARGYCKEVGEQGGIEVDFVHASVPRYLPDDVALCLYRIVQESLRNVVKHSGAAQARVEILGGREEIRLRISDRGQGFEPTTLGKTPGLGLISMRERLRQVDGDLAIQSNPGQGTRIEVRVPLS